MKQKSPELSLDLLFEPSHSASSGTHSAGNCKWKQVLKTGPLIRDTGMPRSALSAIQNYCFFWVVCFKITPMVLSLPTATLYNILLFYWALDKRKTISAIFFAFRNNSSFINKTISIKFFWTTHAIILEILCAKE